VYNTVPPGTGYIGGYIATTSGSSGFVAAQGMLVLLLDGVSGSAITFTYTDASGNYSFSNIAVGNYIIYPEQFGYHTTESPVVILSSTLDSATKIDFRAYPAARIIIPYTAAGVKDIDQNTSLVVYPNPTSGLLNLRWNDLPAERANVIITDMVGREVYRTVVTINAAQGETQIDPNGLKDGIYLLSIKGDQLNYSGKLVIAK
jgi:hypothetical protein